MKGTGEKKGLLIFFIILGAITGSLAGDVIGSNFRSLQILSKGFLIGMTNPLILNLKAIVITFGISININIMTILGIILAIILYRKY